MESSFICIDPLTQVFDARYNGYATDELFFVRELQHGFHPFSLIKKLQFNHDFGGPPWSSKVVEQSVFFYVLHRWRANDRLWISDGILLTLLKNSPCPNYLFMVHVTTVCQKRKVWVFTIVYNSKYSGFFLLTSRILSAPPCIQTFLLGASLLLIFLL